MKAIKSLFAISVFAAITSLLFFTADAGAQELENSEPEVSARVARVKVLTGEASILRKDANDWEKIVLNLPLVEGDEIVLDKNARMEIQLDSWNFIRLDENSRIKMTTLNEDGVAVSLLTGQMSVKVGKFEGDGKFFEIDAPGTTIAVQKEGLFNINATEAVNGRVALSVTDGGEARVYSDTSGFTIRSGRTATLFLVGSRKGEWDIAEFRNSRDGFSTWVASRDELIARKMKGAHFDKYYDTDFYGADDLNDYGTWVDTSDYGTVWRPHRTTTRVYADWSPYRYGHWRWIPPYGWTWVNDEPWGWVTYHHGRWVYISGYWHWAPYPHPSYRWTRSWWRPAFVSFYYYGGSVCWYPLPFYSRYNDFNRIHYSRWSNRNFARNSRRRPPNTVINIINVPRDYDRRNPSPRREREQIPNRGIVIVDRDRFGRTTQPGRRGDEEVSRRINSSIVPEGLPVLPEFNAPERRGRSEIISRSPREIGNNTPRPGATERSDDGPVDPRLRRGRIFGDRTPVDVPERTMPVDETNPRGTPRRGERSGTGVVTRPERNPNPSGTPEVENPRRNTPRIGDRPIVTPRPERSPNPEPRTTPERESRPTPTPSPRFETPRRSPGTGISPERNPRVETPRPSPTPDPGPRFGTPRRPTNPDQPPKTDSPRPTPTPNPGPRFGTPRQAPNPKQAPRDESPRRTPPSSSREESPRQSPPSRREAPRVTVPPRNSSPPKTETPRKDSGPSRDSRSAPERPRGQMEIERND